MKCRYEQRRVGARRLSGASRAIRARYSSETRRVPWSELGWVDPEPVDPTPQPAKPGDSPALFLLQHVWREIGHGTHHARNNAMQDALALAIASGMTFGLDDFDRCFADFRARYWMDLEGSYARACHGPHGPNPSAYQALEKFLGRVPFIIHESCTPQGFGPKVRLAVGSRFRWPIDLKTSALVAVTSFADQPKDKKPPYLIACSYKVAKDCSRQVDKTFRITHKAIAAYHAACRAVLKKRQASAEAAC